jgi:hypothetical protein
MHPAEMFGDDWLEWGMDAQKNPPPAAADDNNQTSKEYVSDASKVAPGG